jgi:hypothetical protein
MSTKTMVATGKFGEVSPVMTAAIKLHHSHQGYCDDGVIAKAERTDHDRSP